MEKGRRDFIKQLALAGFAFQMTGLLSCSSRHDWPSFHFPTSLTPQDLYFLYQIHQILFPDDGEGPNCDEIQSIEHVLWSISVSSSDQEKFVNGLLAAKKIYDQFFDKDFRDVSNTEWQQLVQVFSEHHNTKDWIYMNLSYILESLSMDPIYGVNQNEIGWKWLEHQPGYPRPELKNKYDTDK